jgi:hypothetical protein
MSERYIIPAADYVLIQAALPANYSFGVAMDDGSRCITDKEIDRINANPPLYLYPSNPPISDEYWYPKSMDDISQELFGSDWITYATPYRKPKYLIWQYSDVDNDSENWYNNPAKLDYKKLPNGQLYPNRTFVRGELTHVSWHPDESFLQDPWIDVAIVYTRDNADRPLHRTTTRKWKRDDGTWGPEISKKKLYYPEPAAIMREGEVRRGNVFNHTIAVVFGYLEATAPVYQNETDVNAIRLMGQSFLTTYQAEFEGFIKFSKTDILTAINSDSTAWLDNIIDAEGTTIRDFAYDAFNIWGL